MRPRRRPRRASAAWFTAGPSLERAPQGRKCADRPFRVRRRAPSQDAPSAETSQTGNQRGTFREQPSSSVGNRTLGHARFMRMTRRVN